ncbi:U4/U6 small nuclear ribonucleoprotein Prp4-like [Oscarella lobularis]|uniref:U4/U6 small nuclear ribonucleoprotein Prp4-like n=1 Tax=Oscarella lobularis TaxID=121494 RepID=UPI003313A246
MADDQPAAKRVRIAAGSKDEEARQPLSSIQGLSPAVQAGIKAGNINFSDGGSYDLSTVSEQRQQEVLAEFEKRKKARAIAVPTDDTQIKARLREFGEPICLFGEGPADRRERLRVLLAELGGEALRKEKEEKYDEEEQQEVWYHEGSEALRYSRLWITEYSLPRARERLKTARIERARPDPERASKIQSLHKRLRTFSNYCSQVGDERPVSVCQFAANSKLLATGSWTGLCKLWSIPQCEEIRVLRGHDSRVGGIAFHPEATVGLSDSAACLASGAADGKINLWSLESDVPLASLDCMTDRVSRVAFHPSGRYVGACCFDNSWRLWDLQTQTEILHQEGHSRPVYGLSFQHDGSILATGGLDAMVLVWDLRSGKCVQPLQGHLKAVLAVDFSPNGYHIATGSEDHSMKVWDLRKRKPVYTVPAHTNLVSHLRFQGGDGRFIVTGGYDCTAKIWSHPGWSPLKTLAGHEGKVMCVDRSPDGEFIVTSSYDRTFKLWSPEVLPAYD